MLRWLRRRTLIGLSLACLALALGVTAAIFTVADGLLYRPLPFPDSDKLAVLSYRKTDAQIPAVAYDPAFRSERERLRAVITESGLVESSTEIVASGYFGRAAEQTRLQAVQVDVRFFEVFRLGAFRGSLQSSDLTRAIDEVAMPTAVIGYELWQRLGRPELGVAAIEGKRVTVAAILLPDARFPGETNVWVITRPSTERPPTHVRLKRDAQISELEVRVPALEIRSLRDNMRPAGTEPVLVLLLAGGLVVLISWVQLAGLLLADLLSRTREFGVRLSLGATPRQMFATLLFWHGLAAIGVGVGALAVAPVALRVLTLALPPELTYGQYLSLDVRSLLFLALTVVVGFGVLACPPIWALRLPPLWLMRSRVEGSAVRVSRLRQAMLVIQLTVAAALLYVTSLLGHSLANAVRYDYGFASDDVLLFEPPMPAPDSADFEYRAREKARLTGITIDELRRNPEATSAAILYRVPLASPTNHTPWEDLRSLGGLPMRPGTQVHSTVVGREFVSALGASVVQGRAFDRADEASGRAVALVNVTFVRTFGGSVELDGSVLLMNVVGKGIETTWFKGTVVGVVQDLVFSKISDPPVPQVFFLESSAGSPPFVAIRLARGPNSVAGLKSALEDIWGPLTEWRLIRLRDLWDRSLAPYRGQAELVGLLALFAIPLAAVGVAGFMLFMVRAENRAMAIRLAVGADPRQVRNEVFKRAVATAALGIGAGVATGIGLGKVMSAKLFGTSSFDVISLTLTVLVITLVVIAATWVPARSASRVNPSLLLRSDGE